jgi:hypothetical protein
VPLAKGSCPCRVRTTENGAAHAIQSSAHGIHNINVSGYSVLRTARGWCVLLSEAWPLLAPWRYARVHPFGLRTSDTVSATVGIMGFSGSGHGQAS